MTGGPGIAKVNRTVWGATKSHLLPGLPRLCSVYSVDKRFCRVWDFPGWFITSILLFVTILVKTTFAAKNRSKVKGAAPAIKPSVYRDSKLIRTAIEFFLALIIFLNTV
jgi:hypothetical protein